MSKKPVVFLRSEDGNVFNNHKQSSGESDRFMRRIEKGGLEPMGRI